MRRSGDPVATKKGRMDIIGKTFGMLTVIEYSHTNKNKHSVWKCKCNCGNELDVIGIHLKSGHTQSCGCHKSEVLKARAKHGKRQTRLYRIWLDMKSRCKYTHHDTAERYAARGIVVCDEWCNSFEAFCEWAMANGYTDELSIDRINNNGNYEPSNCRWATRVEQANNTQNNVFITYENETKTLSQWARVLGIPYSTIHARYRAGKTPDEILRKEVKCNV